VSEFANGTSDKAVADGVSAAPRKKRGDPGMVRPGLSPKQTNKQRSVSLG
jgi:hypothetical protein